MSEAAFDAIVIGAGSGGSACAMALAQGGRNVAVVERERVGGECAFWACVPSKVLLRSADPNAQSAGVPASREARSGDPPFAAAAAWRTSMVDNFRDDSHADGLREAGVTLLRGEAVVAGPGRVRVGERKLRADSIVIATGSENEEPPIEGLSATSHWTSRDATSAGEVPKALIVLGGGAVGVELAQIFGRYGSDVTLVEAGDHLLPGEDEAAAAFVRAALERDGITVRTGTTATRVERHNGRVSVQIKDAPVIEGTQVLVAAGRRPRSRGFGLEEAGLRFGPHGAIEIDDRCRAADGFYAAGDVTAAGMYTHVAKYQGRIAAAAILGKNVRARYDAVPRCVYTSPEIAGVGITREQAGAQGRNIIAAQTDFSEITRPALHSEKPVEGAVGLFADASGEHLIGGWIAGPSASEMIAYIGAAIRAATPIETLLDVIMPYPTFSEALYVTLDRLAKKGGR